MDIINVIGYAWCMLFPTFVIAYIMHDCVETLRELKEIDDEDEEDF